MCPEGYLMAGDKSETIPTTSTPEPPHAKTRPYPLKVVVM